ncbi:MAG: hypothetical protein FJ045_03255 [Crenarchaeota archaeon]|nr:hypothetical protein [Thermoproteota archaeon]
MSQTSKLLKRIASSEEYRALEAGVKSIDPQAVFNSYTQISKLMEEAEAEALEKIKNLPRQDKEPDLQQFRSAFDSRSRTMIPQWYGIEAELKKRKIMNGKVSGVGSKGDPLVKTSEGRVVVIAGATLKEGEKVRFIVVSEGDKVDFGRVFELTPDTFYSILTQDKRDEVRNSFNSIKGKVDHYLRSRDANQVSELSQLLKELEGFREFASQLTGEEKERNLAWVTTQRKGLLKVSMPRLVFDFLSKQEGKEIEKQGDSQQIARAMSAPGLLRYQAHLALKTQLLGGEKPKGYSELVDKLQQDMGSMDSALKLMDFEAKIDEVYPAARRYLERMDRFFQRLAQKANQLADSLSESKDYEIQRVIEEVFSGQALSAELKQVFRSPDEFFSLRRALAELRARLGDTESILAEAALESYLRQTMNVAIKA